MQTKIYMQRCSIPAALIAKQNNKKQWNNITNHQEKKAE